MRSANSDFFGFPIVPLMLRNSRTLTRIFFSVVLVAGLMGGWVASSLWTVDIPGLLAPNAQEQTDWVDALSLVGEQVIQFFLGWTHQ